MTGFRVTCGVLVLLSAAAALAGCKGDKEQRARTAAQIAALKSNSGKLAGNLNKAMSELAAAADARTQLQDQLQAAQADVAALQRKLDSATGQIAKLEEPLAKLAVASEQMAKDAEAALKGMQDQLKEQTKKFGDLESQITELKRTDAKLQSTMKDLLDLKELQENIEPSKKPAGR